MDFNRDNFVGFWSNTEKEKKKGSGVGLLIHKKWERHLGQVKKDSPYYLEATFLFKQLELIIIMVYIPPNNKEITRAVQQSIVKKVAQGSQRNQYIIMGDFNYVPDQTLDRKCPRSQHKKFPLYKWLYKQEFVDSYRVINPDSKEFTWSRQDQSSRIDQIWTSKELGLGIVEAKIEKMST